MHFVTLPKKYANVSYTDKQVQGERIKENQGVSHDAEQGRSLKEEAWLRGQSVQGEQGERNLGECLLFMGVALLLCWVAILASDLVARRKSRIQIRTLRKGARQLPHLPHPGRRQRKWGLQGCPLRGNLRRKSRPGFPLQEAGRHWAWAPEKLQ